MTESIASPASYVRVVLSGLGEAAADATGQPRISDKELLALLPESDETNKLALAGVAYGAAKKLASDYPGPAILLFGAALDAIGSAPRTELQQQIRQVRRLLKKESLADNPDVQTVLDAAQALSKFDKVTEKLKAEFSQGLRDSGKYKDDEIDELAAEIVEVTHAVRHKGLVQRFYYVPRQISPGSTEIRKWDQPEAKSSSDTTFMYEAQEFEIIKDRLAELVIPAQIGCAHGIWRRLEERRTSNAKN